VNPRPIFDTFALLCLFHKEPGWDQVRDVLRHLAASGEAGLMSLMNWGEFYYIVKRRVGKEKTEDAMAVLEQLPIEVLPVDDLLVREAAEIKADHPISYADAFCVALALRHRGRILTGDPEFRSIERLVPVQWLVEVGGPLDRQGRRCAK
jgi:uncharacterized protein